MLLVSCRGNELDADAEYDVDGGLDMYESRKKKGTKVCTDMRLPDSSLYSFCDHHDLSMVYVCIAAFICNH